jgi:hypothetical protein
VGRLLARVQPQQAIQLLDDLVRHTLLPFDLLDVLQGGEGGSRSQRPEYVALKVQKSAEHYIDAAYDEIELLKAVAKQVRNVLFHALWVLVSRLLGSRLISDARAVLSIGGLGLCLLNKTLDL